MSKTESFKARVQAAMRLQVPVLIRWKYKLKPGSVLHVEVSTRPLNYERFYTRLRKDGRITIPKIYAANLGLEPGMIVTVQVDIPEEDKQEETILEPLKPIQVETLKVPK